MTDYAELEIGLHHPQADSYEVELRFSQPDSETEIGPERAEFELDLEKLQELEADPEGYGRELARAVFAAAPIAKLYAQAKAVVATAASSLRVRLAIAPSAPELHGLRWELLFDRETDRPMATSEQMLFSRFMTSQDWRTVKIRSKSELRSLIAVSAPSDLERYQLAPVDAAGEVARATTALAGTTVDVLGADEPLTVEALIERLRRDPVDILYLVCHGALTRKGPHLWLQNADGTTAVTHGSEVADRLRDMQDLPRLVVLATCESASTRADLAALAPRLAEAGVPAIVAMQGKISMETVELVIPVFFRELLVDGQIDRAMAVARGAVRDRHDQWMPALFLRLKRGRLWYEAGFGDEEGDFDKWESILRHVQSGKFVPLIGSGVADRICGSAEELAHGLARRNKFPLSADRSSDLAQVTQFLSIRHDVSYGRNAVTDGMKSELLKRFGRRLPDGAASHSLPKLLDAVTALELEADGGEVGPHRILAELDGSVYVATTADTLMYKALSAAGKKPEAVYCDWRVEPPEEPEVGFEPNPGQPLVYHMFGLFGRNDSLVLTEDDYFDYLIAAASYSLVPKVVRSWLASSALMFLGFQMTDWSFRVLFRQLVNLHGGSRRHDFSHVGVQVNPDEGTFADAKAARRYFETYFDKEANVWIFWGSSAEFLQELKRQLDNQPASDAPASSDGGDDDWL